MCDVRAKSATHTRVSHISAINVAVSLVIEMERDETKQVEGFTIRFIWLGVYCFTLQVISVLDSLVCVVEVRVRPFGVFEFLVIYDDFGPR